jgi:NTP pyrophosphatase (non-canonical NTP hydrolase)
MKYLDYKLQASRTLSSTKELYSPISDHLEIKLDSLHCVIGIMTEVQEMEAGLVVGDLVNMKEELGDMMWYIANYENVQLIHPEELEFFAEDLIEKEHPMWIGSLKDCAELLLDMWKKKVFYNSQKYDNMINDTMARLKHEVVKFCQTNDWDIYSIMQTNIDKLKARYPEKFTTDDADNRDLDTERKILENGKV